MLKLTRLHEKSPNDTRPKLKQPIHSIQSYILYILRLQRAIKTNSKTYFWCLGLSSLGLFSMRPKIYPSFYPQESSFCSTSFTPSRTQDGFWSSSPSSAPCSPCSTSARPSTSWSRGRTNRPTSRPWSASLPSSSTPSSRLQRSGDGREESCRKGRKSWSTRSRCQFWLKPALLKSNPRLILRKYSSLSLFCAGIEAFWLVENGHTTWSSQSKCFNACSLLLEAEIFL